MANISDFSQLLQEAEKLTYDLDTTTELPRVERSLKQVLDASNDLYTRVAQSGSKDIQANLLLGSKGIDLPKIVQKLESISTKRTFEPIQPIDDLDVENALENEIRNIVLESFDSGYNEMLKDVFDHAFEHENGEWKQHKRKILSALSGHGGPFIESGSHLNILMEKPVKSSTKLGPTPSIYVSKIIEYNTSVARGLQKPSLVNKFNNIAGDFKDSKVKDMWEIIKYMVQLPPFPQSDDPVQTRNSKPFIEALASQGRKYLEDRYKTYMTNIINENLSQAGLGGIPGTYPLVRSFVGLRLQGEYLGLQDGTIDERPLWPMVFYCLRSGDLSAALYCIRRSHLGQFDEIVKILEKKLENPRHPDMANLEEKIKYVYRRSVRNETDPFKRIIWAVLGCCDISDEHSEVARTADDYLWLKLNFVRVDSGSKDDFIDYSDLQHMILEEYGESHYDAFNQPHLYFQVLALTGQFEAALEFLSRIERFRVHAVHMAIALNELYMLAGPADPGASLICADPMDPKPFRRLNLARLIMLYVRSFELTCPNEALHYFYLLRNYKNSEGDSLFKICICDLVIETKEYEKILGRVQENGIRKRGLIDQFTSNTNITTESIAQIVGQTLVKKGLYEEAVDVYDVANNQEEVINLLCLLLSQVVHTEHEPGSLRERLAQKAMLYSERYNQEGYKCSASLATSFIKLRDLLIFFDQYYAKQYPQAMKTLSEIQLIPFRADEIDDRVKSFKNYTPEVCKVVPDLLLATMNILFAQYQKIKASVEFIPRYQDSSIEKQLQHLREQAKTLTNFTGILPYRMPGETNSRLVQMEILMH